MNDIQEIKNLIFAYAEQLDLGNLGSVAEIFVKGEIYAQATDSTEKGKENIVSVFFDIAKWINCASLSNLRSMVLWRTQLKIIENESSHINLETL